MKGHGEGAGPRLIRGKGEEMLLYDCEHFHVSEGKMEILVFIMVRLSGYDKRQD